MNKEVMKSQLLKIHNTLTQIEVSGDNTILMANCIVGLRQLLAEMDKKEDE